MGFTAKRKVGMAIPLHPKCRARLTDVLTEGIESITADHGMFVNRASAFIGLYQADKVIPETGKLRDDLERYIDEMPVLEFVSDTISEELRELDQFRSNEPTVPLTAIDGYQDARATAERLLAALESLPWQYTISLKVPEPLSQILGRFITDLPLGRGMRLVKPSAEFARSFPLNAEDPKRHKRIHAPNALLIPIPEDVTWDGNAVYLQTEATGFIGPYGGSVPELEARRIVGAFFGLGIALDLFEIDWKYGTSLPKLPYFVHRKHADVWQIDNKLEFSDDDSRLIANLQISTLNGSLDTEEKKQQWATAALKGLQLVMSAGPRSAQLLLAAQWLFDSYKAHDQLLSYVATMVVLEILLGDGTKDDEIGLGELMRNRCAYFIGTTQTERAELLAEFSAIYKVRSQIVHRGKHRLNLDERVQLNRLRWMCRRVFQRELQLLAADRK